MDCPTQKVEFTLMLLRAKVLIDFQTRNYDILLCLTIVLEDRTFIFSDYASGICNWRTFIQDDYGMLNKGENGLNPRLPLGFKSEIP